MKLDAKNEQKISGIHAITANAKRQPNKLRPPRTHHTLLKKPLFDKTDKEQGRHILFCTEKGLRKRATGKRHLPQPEIYDPKMTLLRI